MAEAQIETEPLDVGLHHVPLGTWHPPLPWWHLLHLLVASRCISRPSPAFLKNGKSGQGVARVGCGGQASAYSRSAPASEGPRLSGRGSHRVEFGLLLTDRCSMQYATITGFHPSVLQWIFTYQWEVCSGGLEFGRLRGKDGILCTGKTPG